MKDFTLIVDSLFDNWTSYGVISNHLFSALVESGFKNLVLRPWEISDRFHPALKVVPRVAPFAPLPVVKRGALWRTFRMSGSDSAGGVYYQMLADTPPVLGSIAKLKETPFIIVPAQGTREYFENEYGLTNVRVVHRGAAFEYTIRNNPNYTFLYVGYLHRIKGVDLVFKAFARAFPGVEDVRLIVKINDPKSARPVGVPHEEELLSEVEQDSRIQIIKANWEHEDLGVLYANAHAFVYPFRSLGFSCGKAALEARKSGCLTLIPRIGDALLWGTKDYLLDYKLVSDPGHENREFDGYWGGARLDYDIDEIAAKMRAAYVDRATAPPLDGWTWKDSARELLDIFKEE